jgi:hypothetical protein
MPNPMTSSSDAAGSIAGRPGHVALEDHGLNEAEAARASDAQEAGTGHRGIHPANSGECRGEVLQAARR